MKDHGRYVVIPASDYPPIQQACVVLKSSKSKDVARQFLAFLKTAAVSDLLKGYGFDVPGVNP
jgi:ABC-type molybdate transport system substrate-binding protein